MEHSRSLTSADISFLKGGGRTGFKNDMSAEVFP